MSVRQLHHKIFSQSVITLLAAKAYTEGQCVTPSLHLFSVLGEPLLLPLPPYVT